MREKLFSKLALAVSRPAWLRVRTPHWALPALVVLLAVAPQVAHAQPTTTDPIVAAAGDIACDPSGSDFYKGHGTSTDCRQWYTSNLLGGVNRVLSLGDNQYQEGTLNQYLNSYKWSWGRFKGLTSPVVGNHEYRTPRAWGYFDYFNGVGNWKGRAGSRDSGYYSYNLGKWHLIALNSACGYSGDGGHVPGGCTPGSPEYEWLKRDLAANPRLCTLAYWHHALWNSDEEYGVRYFWNLLYAAHADLVLNGHDHDYERFAPMTPAGTLARNHGIRQIIVGTGGRNHGAVQTGVPHRQVANNTTFGVLRLRLHPTSYEWRFVHEQGKSFTDYGKKACH
jgi:hypothetical protein